MEVKDVVERVKQMRDCEVYPPKGCPACWTEQCRLPDDLMEFYTSCGGLGLFLESDYPIYIVASEEFVPANPIIVGELCPEDRSSQWYLVADDKNGQYITMDLSAERLGQCYDSFWDRHGLAGSCPIIARTFTELLSKLVDNGGAYWYWLQDEFQPLGDAYDEEPAAEDLTSDGPTIGSMEQ